MTEEKLEQFKEDAEKAAGKEVEEKVDTLKEDETGQEKTKDDVQKTFE